MSWVYSSSRLTVSVQVEDDFGSGTANSHFDEGWHEGSPSWTLEPVLTIDGVNYPKVENEIMSGIMDTYNYLTPMTVGVLQDLNYVINTSSSYITSTGTNLSILS